MYQLGNVKVPLCSGVNRRSFLQVGGLGTFGLTLPQLRTMRYISICVLVALSVGSRAIVAEDSMDVTLKVRRTSQMNGYLCTMEIYFDDRLVGSLRDGQSKEFRIKDVKPGKHAISDKCYDFGGTLQAESGKRLIIVGRSPSIEVSIAFRSPLSAKGDSVFDADVAEVVSIEFDDTLKSVNVKKSPPIILAAGTSKVVEDTIRIRHSVSVSESWTAGSDVKAKVKPLWFQLEGSLRYEIQRATTQSYEIETERKRSVTLTGNGTGAKVVWVEYYRTGVAKMKLSVDDSEIEIPFEFKDDFDLITE